MKTIRWRMTTQGKTTLILLSAFFSIILLFSGFVYLSVLNYSNNDFNRLLELRALTFAKAQFNEGLNNEVKDLHSEFFEKLPHEHDYFFKLIPGKSFESEAKTLGVPITFFETVRQEGKAEHQNDLFFFKGIRYTGAKGAFIVVASAKNYFHLHYSTYLKKTLFFAVAAAFIFWLIISLYFSKYIFNPLRKITERVRQISSQSLHLRLDYKNNNDELKELVMTFNNMLDRIETSFETQNNFISNASHELKTPLTAIIGESEVTLSKERSSEEYVETLNIILQEAEKLDQKTKSLLLLAQTGFNGKVQKFDKIRIDQLIWEVHETIERLNPKNNVYLDLSLLPENPAKLTINGNETLLHLAFCNVINNACKYSDFRQVQISIGASDIKVFIVVSDSGIGIPENELKYIYDPFFRASNTKDYEGYGIGLPLTRNIIRMHKGEIVVNSLIKKGTTVEISLPLGNFT